MSKTVIKKTKPITRSKKMPAKSTSKQKSRVSRKANTGKGGFRVANGLNWRRALPVIVIVAVVGGALVFQSFASQAVPKTTTRTITETIPDRSKSYKTLKASSLNGARSSITGRTYNASTNAWSPNEPVIRNEVVQTKFGWVGPENITVCATVLGQSTSSVIIQVKNSTGVSSQGPEVVTRSTTIGEQLYGQKVSPTEFVYTYPDGRTETFEVGEQNQRTQVKKTEVCTGMITRGNYGSDMTVTITAPMFESLRVYGVQMTNGRSNGTSNNPQPAATQYTNGSSGSSSQEGSSGNSGTPPSGDGGTDGTSPDQSGSGSYTTDGGGSEAEGTSSTAESGNNNDSGMKSKRWWPF